MPIPLEIFALVVAVGVAGIVGLTYVVGWGAETPLPDLQTALNRLRDDFPEVEATDSVLAADGRVAAFEIRDTAAIALVFVLGDKWVTRLVDARAIQRVEAADAVTLRLMLKDFARPRLDIALADSPQLTDWRGRFEALTRPRT